MAKHRLQFDFSDAALKEINDLQEATGLRNRAELVRQALRLLQWMLKETQNNRANILVEKEGNIRQIVFPFWSLTNASHQTDEHDKVRAK